VGSFWVFGFLGFWILGLPHLGYYFCTFIWYYEKVLPFWVSFGTDKNTFKIKFLLKMFLNG
jgi:hypothetical protein